MLAATLRAIGAATWERVGYVLAPARLGGLRLALLIAGVAALAGCACDGLAGLARGRRFHGCRRARRRSRRRPSGNRHASEPGRSRRISLAARAADPVVSAAMAPRRRLSRALRSQRRVRLRGAPPTRAFAAHRSRHGRDARRGRVGAGASAHGRTTASAQTPRRRSAACKLALIRRQGTCLQNTRRRRRAGKSRPSASGEARAAGRSDE